MPPTEVDFPSNHSTSIRDLSKVEIRKEGKIGRVYPAYMTTWSTTKTPTRSVRESIDTYAAAQHVDQGLFADVVLRTPFRDVNKARVRLAQGIKTLYYIRLAADGVGEHQVGLRVLHAVAPARQSESGDLPRRVTS